MMVSNFAWDDRYQVAGLEGVLTPALVVYPEAMASNIATVLDLLGGDADRWRVHIKTAKLAYTLRMLIDRGVRHFKCATTLELLTACENGAKDVLLAYAMVGANARRVREIAEQFPDVQVSILSESEEQMRQWSGGRVGIFLDVNPGMNRTGIEQNHIEQIVELAQTARAAGLEFRGLHYYDGQFAGVEERARTAAAHRGYDQLLRIVDKLQRSGVNVPEVITAGTPTLPCSLGYEGFRGKAFVHRVSPGTIVYGDATSLAQLPREWNLRPAVLVAARVVSHPCAGKITGAAGHKAVSADAGVPTCLVAGHPELTPLAPSEEHLPIAAQAGAATPRVGEILYLLPRHVCPTVNNFDEAVLVRNNAIEGVEKVTARGHEAPLLRTQEAKYACHPTR
jgi:D-serine deaminase-like pyridoxal phosphate-dependent protein